MKKALLAAIGLCSCVSVFAQPPQGGGAMPDPTEMFMKKLDTSGDGKVSLEEFQAPGNEMFKEMDTNGDGAIDKAETAAYHQKMMKKMEEMRQKYGNRPPQGGPGGQGGGYGPGPYRR